MPVGVIVMCCMSGCGLMHLSGMVEMSSFCVNTDWKQSRAGVLCT